MLFVARPLPYLCCMCCFVGNFGMTLECKLLNITSLYILVELYPVIFVWVKCYELQIQFASTIYTCCLNIRFFFSYRMAEQLTSLGTTFRCAAPRPLCGRGEPGRFHLFTAKTYWRRRDILTRGIHSVYKGIIPIFSVFKWL